MNKDDVDYHSYRIGGNVAGEIISDIFYVTDNYIIYITKGSKIIAFEYNDDETYDPRYEEISEDVSRVNGLITTYGEVKKYSMRIADAIDAGLNGHGQTAKKILQNLERTMQNYKIVKGRLIYSFSSLSFVILNTIIVLTLRIFGQRLPLAVTDLYVYFIIVLCGSFGGYLSVSLKMKGLNIDIDSGSGIHIASGLSRMFISAISAIILYIIIISNAFLGFINFITAENRFYVICGLAVVAGFSESFIPDILKKIEKKEVEKTQG